MPRGKNYVNQGKGVTLQASTKKGGQKMTVCQYGTGCNRPDCIYEHPYGKDDGKGRSSANGSQSREPCMAYLADMCTFSASGCRKRHPPPLECERLIAKYAKVKCRFGVECQTKGCLYMHPGDEGYEDVGFKTNAREPTYLVQEDMAAAFPPLGASGSGPGVASASASASAAAGNWKPSPVGGNVQPGSHAPSYGANVHQQQQYATYQQQYYGQGGSSQQYGMQSAYGQGYGYEGQGQMMMMGAVGATHAHASAQTFHQHRHLQQQQNLLQQQQCESGCGPLANSRRTDDDEFPPLSSPPDRQEDC